GWDTHVNQGASEGQLAARLAELGQTLTAFAQDLGEKLEDVVVLTMSEFGRTVRENGNSGTDHGHATAMLVLGGPVNGGRVLGKWPGLDPASRFEGRDVAVTTDLREMFEEVLARMGPRVELSPEAGRVEAQVTRVLDQVVVVQRELALEQAVVHLPELPLRARRFGRLRRVLGVRMALAQREVTEHEAQPPSQA